MALLKSEGLNNLGIGLSDPGQRRGQRFIDYINWLCLTDLINNVGLFVKGRGRVPALLLLSQKLAPGS
jgi:hypothetical protein